MKIKTYTSILCCLLGSTTLIAQFAPDDFKGVIIHSVATSAPPYPWNQTLGKTIVGVMDRTETTYSTYLDDPSNEVVQTGISYTYQKQSANVGAFTVWIPALAEYVTTYYTFTSPDAGTLSSTASIGTISGDFKLYKTWNWQEQTNYWNQAVEAQNEHIQQNPSILGLYTQAQLDQAKLDAREGLFTQAQMDAAIAAASKPDVYFRSTEGWTLSDKDDALFELKIERSTDLSVWQTAGQATIDFSDDAIPAFVRINLE